MYVFTDAPVVLCVNPLLSVCVSGDIELVVHYNLPRSIEGFYQVGGLPVPTRGFWDGGNRNPKPYTIHRQLLAAQSCSQAPPQPHTHT